MKPRVLNRDYTTGLAASTSTDQAGATHGALERSNYWH